MDLQKIGIKFFLKNEKSFSSKEYIPLFHQWIQNKSISDHLLIDVADYSHVLDGPGVMLMAHEGHFSLDQEGLAPGMLYMRKMDLEGDFSARFFKVFSITLEVVNLLIQKDLEFCQKSFRFIANDRRLAENNIENQNLYKEKISKILHGKYSNQSWEFDDESKENERLAFSVNFTSKINLLI
tara:strand:+ start:213 stop:758 length:546 start_codon:yes stop_codon:yes gene_type:complete